jgi:hypothetical protein
MAAGGPVHAPAPGPRPGDDRPALHALRVVQGDRHSPQRQVRRCRREDQVGLHPSLAQVRDMHALQRTKYRKFEKKIFPGKELRKELARAPPPPPRAVQLFRL